MKRWLCLIPLLLFSFKSQATSRALSLQECYEIALRYSNTIKISEEHIKQAAAHFAQALGAILPQVQFTGTEFLQDADDFNANSGTGVGGTLTRFNLGTTYFSAAQPLFQGFREIYALKGARADKKMQQKMLANVKRLLFQDVATAYFTVLHAELNIKTTKTMLKASDNRVSELKERVRLGKSRPSELASQESESAQLQAELAAGEGRRLVAYEMLSFLTGLQPQAPIQHDQQVKMAGRSLETYLSTLNARPDVMAMRQEVIMQQSNQGAQRAAFLPNANVLLKYCPYRQGFQSGIRWDSLFTVNVPIFNWGNVGNYRNAHAQLQEAKLQLEQTQRQATTEVRRSYVAFRSSLEQKNKFKTAVEKAKSSYQLQSQDFLHGLVNQLDVLQAERIYLSVQRQLISAEIQNQLDNVNLQINAGVLP